MTRNSLILMGVVIFVAVLGGAGYGVTNGLWSIYDSCIAERTAPINIICLSQECWPAIPPKY